MICISHICLELFLYMIILMRAVASDNDTELEKTLNNTCRKVAEIWNSSCTSDFPHTDNLDNGAEHVSDSSICLSWNISVTVDGEECTIISKCDYFLDEEDKCNLTYQDENVPTNTCNGESTDQITDSRDEESAVDNNDGKDESSKDGGDKNKNSHAYDDGTDIPKECKKCCKRCKERKKEKGKGKGKERKKPNNGIQGTSSGSNERPTQRGILALTHIVAAAIGAGILYCVLFMKKIKRRLNNKNEEERNTGINNASYNLQMGSTENMSVPFFSHHDEGVYCEVADKPRSLPFHNNASLHSFAENVSEGRKNTRLPDIPHQTEKDYNQYLTPISRSLPNEYLNSSGKAITETYTMDENELQTEDGKIKDNSVLNDVDSLKDTFETETFGQYFVLEKSTDMDLK